MSTYKICNKLSDISFDEFFVWSKCSYNLCRHIDTKTLTFKDKPKHKE